MTRRKQEAKKLVPEFSSHEEEAKFWDTHDISDYWDGMRPARVRFAKQLSEGITIRLDPRTLAELRFLATERGIGPTTLARMWILDNLRKATAPAGQTRRR